LDGTVATRSPQGTADWSVLGLNVDRGLAELSHSRGTFETTIELPASLVRPGAPGAAHSVGPLFASRIASGRWRGWSTPWPIARVGVLVTVLSPAPMGCLVVV